MKVIETVYHETVKFYSFTYEIVVVIDRCFFGLLVVYGFADYTNFKLGVIRKRKQFTGLAQI